MHYTSLIFKDCSNGTTSVPWSRVPLEAVDHGHKILPLHDVANVPVTIPSFHVLRAPARTHTHRNRTRLLLDQNTKEDVVQEVKSPKSFSTKQKAISHTIM